MTLPVKTVLTIAGSDSIGGAGIQMDLKALSAIGVHGCSAVSCITAQNTERIDRVDATPPDLLRAQISSVLDDITPAAIKTGAIYSSDNVRVIADILSDENIPIVVDPVLSSTTGSKLSEDDFVSVLRSELIPISAIVTPNVHEAESLSGVRIAELEQAAEAAEKLHSLGASGVLITGVPDDDKIADYLSLSDGSTQLLRSSRWPGDFHGTGCMLSALIAGNIAKGFDMSTAVTISRGIVFSAIERGMALGKGIKLIDPLGEILIGAERGVVLEALERIRPSLSDLLSVDLIPEVGSNIGYSIPSPSIEMDVAGFTGRIVRDGDRARIVGCAKFGASKHVARIILAASKHDRRIRSAINIKFNDRNLRGCRNASLSHSFFSREDEPEGVSSMSWGVEKAIEEFGSVPDIIWDEGGMGKEPMIRVLGETPSAVLDKISRISKNV